MKWKRTALFVVCLPAVIFLWREGSYVRSLQYKLDRIVASGRTSFELREVLGDDWKTLCFFPTTYEDVDYKHDNLYSDKSNDMLITWMKESLGRPITGDDWQYVISASDELVLHFLTDKGQLRGVLPAGNWQGNDPNEYYVACTSAKAQLVQIFREGTSVRFDSAFERIWELKK